MSARPVCTNSAAGLDEAYSQLEKTLRTYLRRRLPNPDQVDDLLQEVFLKALSALDSGRQIENLTGWLYSTARTTLADYYRKLGPTSESFDDAIPDDAEDESKTHQELASCLRPLIERLPPLYRDTLLAIEYQGKSMRELAVDQGVSISAIKSRAARGRSKLRGALLECCQVEASGGLVREYQSNTSNNCDAGCG